MARVRIRAELIIEADEQIAGIPGDNDCIRTHREGDDQQCAEREKT